MRAERLGPCGLILWTLMSGAAPASSLAGEGGVLPRAGALLPASLPGGGAGAVSGSLFAGRDADGFFAPPPEPVPEVSEAALARLAPVLGPRKAALRDLIASVEAGSAGYDAVVWSAKRKPQRPPTRLTLAEIEAWIAATPGQNHAIGRYQFIPATLRRVAAELGVSRRARFTPALQDAMADLLLEEAGFSAHLAGGMGRVAFMNNLAAIWAGLPNASGRSHYHGVAGNRAAMTWSRFSAEMARIFPGAG